MGKLRTRTMFDTDLWGAIKCKLLGWHKWVYDLRDGYILKTCERCPKQKKSFYNPINPDK